MNPPKLRTSARAIPAVTDCSRAPTANETRPVDPGEREDAPDLPATSVGACLLGPRERQHERRHDRDDGCRREQDHDRQRQRRDTGPVQALTGRSREDEVAERAVLDVPGSGRGPDQDCHDESDHGDDPGRGVERVDAGCVVLRPHLSNNEVGDENRDRAEERETERRPGKTAPADDLQRLLPDHLHDHVAPPSPPEPASPVISR